MKKIIDYFNIKPNAIIAIVAIIAILLSIAILNKRVVKVNVFDKFIMEVSD